MTYSKQLQDAIESDLSVMIMDWVEERFSDEWCVGCERRDCPEDFWDDKCPMYTQLLNAKDVADEFAHIMVEAFNR